MKLKEQSLQLHYQLKGKLNINSKLKLNNRHILTKVYTPGVAYVSRKIYQNPKSAYDLTIKGNTVAVVSDGSAVLGLGNVGPTAALPVMEGKCMIFKEFAGINAFPICLNTQKTGEIEKIIKNISPVFSAINLEDISAPRCFEIEKNLQNIGIPVMHDDQHATAIVVLSGLINACKVVKKKLSSCKIVVNGAGAAGSAIVRILSIYEVKDIIILDSKGIISSKRIDLDSNKKSLLTITNSNNLTGNLLKATKNADILIGVSQKNLFTRQIISSMSKDPIVFALANPDPEILPEKAIRYGVKIVATGRSDYPNQINNALVFPGFFKGLIENRLTKITDRMKINAAYALSSLIKNPSLNRIIPSIFNQNVVSVISKSVKVE